jgi:DUF4097 and DUF4098 domain-containing protein YvlB
MCNLVRSIGLNGLGLLLAAYIPSAPSQTTDALDRVISVAEPLKLDIELENADITVARGSKQQVHVTATLQGQTGTSSSGPSVQSILTIENNGGLVKVRDTADPSFRRKNGSRWIICRIDVPEKAEVKSAVQNGNLEIVGVEGPVRATTGTGNVSVSFVLKEAFAQARSGDVEIDSVYGRVSALTRDGNISCTRARAGVTAQTGDGDITLIVTGPSDAVVQHGRGKIDIRGAVDAIVASTDAGELSIKAAPHQDWRLTSVSGTIRVEMPSSARFEIDAASGKGGITVRPQDMHGVSPTANNRLVQKVNGGGKKIQLRSQNGKIIVGLVSAKERDATRP